MDASLSSLADDLEDVNLEKSVSKAIKSEEEIESLTVDEKLTGIERAVYLLSSGQDIQRISVIENLPDLLLENHADCLRRVVPKVKEVLHLSQTELQLVASAAFLKLLEDEVVSLQCFSQTFLPTILTCIESKDIVVFSTDGERSMSSMEKINFDRAHYCIFGDSHISRISPHYFPPGLVQVSGFSGADTRRMKHIARLSTGHCRHIIVMPGANDVLNHRCPTLTKSDLMKMLVALAPHTKRLTIVVPFDMPQPGTSTADLYDIIYYAMEQAYLRLPDTVDVRIERKDPLWPSQMRDFREDQVHLRDHAQRQLAVYLQSILHGYSRDEEPRPFIEPVPLLSTSVPHRSGGFGMPPSHTVTSADADVTLPPPSPNPLMSSSAKCTPDVATPAQPYNHPAPSTMTSKRKRAKTGPVRNRPHTPPPMCWLRRLPSPTASTHSAPTKAARHHTAAVSRTTGGTLHKDPSSSPPKKKPTYKASSPTIRRKRKRTHTPPHATDQMHPNLEPRPHQITTAANMENNQDVLITTNTTVTSLSTNTADFSKPQSTLRDISTCTDTPITPSTLTATPTRTNSCTHTIIPATPLILTTPTTPDKLTATPKKKRRSRSSGTKPSAAMKAKERERISLIRSSQPLSKMPEGKDTRLQKQRERTASCRASETQEQSETRKQKHRQRMASHLAAETSAESDTRRAGERARSASCRASETREESETRKQKHRQRMASHRAAETSAESDTRRAGERARSASCRASETREESETRKQKHRQRMASHRAAETSAESDTRRAGQRARSASCRAAETPEKSDERQQKQRARTLSRLAAETSDEGDARRLMQRARSESRRASETPEKSEKRRQNQRERTLSRLAAETSEESDARLLRQREQAASRHAFETPLESDTRRQNHREQSRLLRESETPIQREVRLADLRGHAAATLEAETPSDTEGRRAANAETQRRTRMARLKEVLRTKKQLGRINDVSYFDEGVLANLTNGQIFHRLPLLKQQSNKCDHCGAYVWRSGGKNVPKERPGFCCENGKVPYEPPQEPPEVLRALYLDNPRHANKSFLDSLRSYNNSLALASLGCNEIRMPGFSPTFKIQGKVYHMLGSLIPPDGDEPSFAQIYFNDTDHEVDNRLRHNPHLNRDILTQLQDCLHDVNSHVQNLKKAIDFNIEQPDVPLVMQGSAPQGQHERRYNLPTAGEVAALLPGEQAGKRDVVIQTHGGQLMRIDASSPLYDPLHYVLLFPYGTSGYTHKLPHSEGHPKDITPYEFYRVRLQIRDEPDTYLLRSRRLMQQYVCDQEAKAEGFRMEWYRYHQRILKAEKYRDLQDAVHANDERRAGTQIVLPPSFTGGPRWYAAKFQDAMAIVREKGKPSAFVTITCNPKWPEITENLLPGQTATDRPDLCVRVFHLKLAAFIDDLDREQALGRVVSYLAMKEDQKRGLPHAHILLIFADADRLHDPETVDRLISAEIPDPELNPELHAVITTNNIHGPCGNLNSNSSCMVKGDSGFSTCSKNYPKDFQNNTIITDERFPEYRRRSPDNGGLTHTTNKGLVLDNRWIVPYNPYLSAKYQCHINVEFVHTVASVKYLYKYLCKGSDRVMVRVDDGTERHDEITSYEDARYIGCTDAFWRICEFNIQLRYPPVEQLPLHLEDHQIVIFTDDNASEIAAGPAPFTKLMGFFDLNQTDPTANAIKYPDIYRHYTWRGNRWVKRKNRMGGHHRDPDSEDMSETVGRIPIIALTPHQSELYFLRMLLYHKCGPTSYEDLRTVEGVVAPTFQEACRRLGFLDDDTIIDSVMAEVGGATFGSHLRAIFSTILIWIKPADCSAFWLRHRDILCEDLMRRDDVQQPTDAIINEVLLDIQENLQSLGYDLKEDFDLDLPDMQAIEARAPREIRDETEFDQNIQQHIVDGHLDQFNEEQRHFYNTVMASVTNDEGKLIGLDAPGGCGKTFCLEAILAAVRSDGGIALATATSGIAATLLPNGRTLHSRFKVPLKVHEASTSHVTKRSATGELIARCKLVVIDEVTMGHRHVYECVDRTFRFIREDDRPFGGATVVFSGDWRQILPVIKRGRPADVLRACLKKSPLWDHVTVMSLTTNMRVQQAQGAEQEFAQYLLDIGDGRVEVFPDLSEYKIKLPEHFTSDMSSVRTLCDFVFDNLPAHTADPTWLCSRAILCPTNKATTDINQYMLKCFPGHERVYKSSDKITDCPNVHHYPAEYLNTIEMSGMPPHVIHLKVGVPVMLLRNLDPARGHCNGTRYTVVALHDHVIEVKVAVGVYAGNRYFIPRIPMSPTDNYFPFTFTRRQFPVRVCFGMTANKAQGQTLSRIGLYLPKDFFSHGQLYVALSRVGSTKSIKILTKNGTFFGKDGIFTENVVLRDILK